MAAELAQTARQQRRHRLLYRLESKLEAPMFLLAIAWLWFFIAELVHGLAPWQQQAVTVIWIVFITEYLLKLYLAPHKLAYVGRNWITLIALVIPAFRALRLLRALQPAAGLLRSVSPRLGAHPVDRALCVSRRSHPDLADAQPPAGRLQR